MPMSAYNLSETAALLVTDEIAAYFMLYFDRKDGTIPEEVRQALDGGRFAEMARSGSGLPEEYYDSAEAADRIGETGIEYRYHGEFEGLAATLDGEDGKYPYPRTWSFDGDRILYIPAKRETSPFHAAYSGIRELEDEFREALGDILPASAGIRPYIVEINGTYVS